MPGALVASAGTRAKYRLEAYATLRHHTSIAFRGAEGAGRPPGQWGSSNDSVGQRAGGLISVSELFIVERSGLAQPPKAGTDYSMSTRAYPVSAHSSQPPLHQRTIRFCTKGQFSGVSPFAILQAFHLLFVRSKRPKN